MSSDKDEADTWDIFLAHSQADTAHAEKLHDHLTTGRHHGRQARVFLASRCVRLGDDWDLAIAKAQLASRVTAVLVTENTSSAYYQREEISAAIALARDSASVHRVVPIILGDQGVQIPYGLRLKHGIRITTPANLNSCAFQLLELLEDIEQLPARLIIARNTANSEATDDSPTLSALAAATANGASAIRAFADSLDRLVISGLRSLDLVRDRKERGRLRDILWHLLSIQNSQAPLPWLLRLHADGRGHVWRQVCDTLAELTPSVAKLTELVAAERGTFMVEAYDAYRSLLFGLRGRSRVYEELARLDPPASTEEREKLRELANTYDEMIVDLKRVEQALHKYLADTPLQMPF